MPVNASRLPGQHRCSVNGNFLFSPFPLHPSWVHSGHSEKTRGMESGQAEDELGCPFLSPSPLRDGSPGLVPTGG